MKKYNMTTVKDFALFLSNLKHFLGEANSGSGSTLAYAKILYLPCSFAKYQASLKQVGFMENEVSPLIMEFYKDHPEVESFSSGNVILHMVYAIKDEGLHISISVISPGDILSKRPQVKKDFYMYDGDESIASQIYWSLADAGLVDVIPTPIEENIRDYLVLGGAR